MAYTGQDLINYQKGWEYLPLQQYSRQYTLPTTEEDQLTTATGAAAAGSAAGIPYTNAFTNAGGGGGGPGGPASYERTWTREREPIVDKNIYMEGKEFGIPESIKYNPIWKRGQPSYDYRGAPKYVNETIKDAPIFDIEENTGILKSLKDKFFQPKYQGELGTRALGQYEAGQKLPFWMNRIAGMQSPFNPESANYNPKWEDQLNYYEGATGGKWTGSGDDLTWTEGDMMIGRDPQSGLLKYGPDSVLAGKNVYSGFGSNDPEEQLREYIAKMEAYKNKTVFQRKKIKQAQDELSGLTGGDPDADIKWDATQEIKDRMTNIGDVKRQQQKQARRDYARVEKAYKEETGGEAGTYGTGESGQQFDDKGQEVGYNDPFDPGGGEKDGGFIDGSNRRPFFYGGLAGVLGRECFAEGGRNWMGDYDPGNTTGWQEKGQVETWSPGGGGETTTTFTGGGGDNNPPVPTDDNIPTYLLEEPKDKNIVDVDWLTTEPEVNVNLERAKARAQLNLINSIRNQQLDAELSGQIGDKFSFTTGINEGDIGNTNLNYGNWSANIDPYANVQDISYANNIGGWDVGGSYSPEEQNLMFNISKTFKHGGLAGIL